MEASERGRALFLEGRDAYQAGDFQTALEKFRLSFELTAQPMLLFNLGSSAGRLRRDDEALRYYEQYLQELPDAANRAEVEGRITQLRAAIQARTAAEARTRAELDRARREAEEANERTEAVAASRDRPTAARVTVAGSGAVAVAGGVMFPLERLASRRWHDRCRVLKHAHANAPSIDMGFWWGPADALRSPRRGGRVVEAARGARVGGERPHTGR